MNAVRPCLALLASGFATASLACDYPALAVVPNGAGSTIEQMVAAQESVKVYMAAMDTYLSCVSSELEAAGDDAPEEFKAIMVSRHNAAVAEMEAVAASFNEQIAAFREANP
ncbi:MAG TPA: hypothetical protein VLD39_01345 [Gammaproteobacteria bacterium]|nr:hypothetical protein [Gammaproteobacteria bacterium]